MATTPRIKTTQRGFDDEDSTGCPVGVVVGVDVGVFVPIGEGMESGVIVIFAVAVVIAYSTE